MSSCNVNVRIVLPVISQGFLSTSVVKELESLGKVVSKSLISKRPASIESDYDSMLGAPGAAARIIEAERESVDAIIINCMGEPGLGVAREAVRIPVIGRCQTGMHFAVMLGSRFSILAVVGRLRRSYENHAAQQGWQPALPQCVGWISRCPTLRKTSR